MLKAMDKKEQSMKDRIWSSKLKTLKQLLAEKDEIIQQRDKEISNLKFEMRKFEKTLKLQKMNKDKLENKFKRPIKENNGNIENIITVNGNGQMIKKSTNLSIKPKASFLKKEREIVRSPETAPKAKRPIKEIHNISENISSAKRNKNWIKESTNLSIKPKPFVLKKERAIVRSIETAPKAKQPINQIQNDSENISSVKGNENCIKESEDQSIKPKSILLKNEHEIISSNETVQMDDQNTTGLKVKKRVRFSDDTKQGGSTCTVDYSEYDNKMRMAAIKNVTNRFGEKVWKREMRNF